MTRLTNARLPDGRRVDLTLQNGRIAAITPHTAPPHTAPPHHPHLRNMSDMRRHTSPTVG